MGGLNEKRCKGWGKGCVLKVVLFQASKANDKKINKKRS